MGVFDIFTKEKEVEERGSQPMSMGAVSLTSYYGDGKLASEEEAMKIPAVAAAIELISSSIAQLPVYLYKVDENNEIERVTDDKRTFLLNDEPNELMNGHNLKKSMIRDYLFHGAAYTKTEKFRNNFLALYRIPIKNASVTKYRQNGYKETAVINLQHDTGGEMHEFEPEELIRVLRNSGDGVTGEGILNTNSDIIKLAIDEMNYTKGILKNGALPLGILNVQSKLTGKAVDKLRDSFQNIYGGAGNSGKTIVLEDGVEYQSVSLNPNDLELTSSKKNTMSEICRIFNIPESMLNSDANKYASNEQNNIYFLQHCLSPIITSIEAAYNKSMLLESEKRQGYYFRFDVSEMLRTTEKEKVASVVAAVNGGLYSINEGRRVLDRPNIRDDYFMWNLGKVYY
ncbi:HK97 family phage portal protein, partial [Sinobaca qinghaiensis]